MIRYTNTRYNGGQGHVSEYSRSVPSALVALIIYELGYGGRVVSTERNRIEVITRVLGAEDHVVFEGSEEEIEPLLMGILLHEEMRKAMRESTEVVDKLSHDLMRVSNGNAFLVAYGAPLLAGGVLTRSKALKVIILLALKYDDKELVETLSDVKNQTEFAAALELLHSGEPADEVLSALQPEVSENYLRVCP